MSDSKSRTVDVDELRRRARGDGLSPATSAEVLDELARLRKDVERKDAALEAAKTLCRCGGTGTYTPSCSMCHDSTWDHGCPDDRKCEDECCLKIRAALQPQPEEKKT